MRLKKPVPFVVAAVLLLVTAAAFTACDQPDKYADLVAVRINGRMAEWTDTAYNFKYEGDSSLNVSVPYTNYLEITDLIVSPEAEGKVYSDSNYTQEITDTEKIHTDGDTSLYIRVTKGKTSHDYTVNVDVSEENLPEGDLSAKDYDNRGGHVYIPENAETVTVDGVEYTVINDEEEIQSDRNINVTTNYILSQDINQEKMKEAKIYKYSGVFNGNGYAYINVYPSGFVSELTESGIIKNLNVTYRFDGYYGSLEQTDCNTGYVVKDNKGTIDNVSMYLEKQYRSIRDDGEKAGHKYSEIGLFVYENNGGTIKNCIQQSVIESRFDLTFGKSKVLLSVAAFAYRSEGGTFSNCVNTGEITVNEDIIDYIVLTQGSFLVCVEADKDTKMQGIYNLGNIDTIERFNTYDGIVGEIADQGEIDFTLVKDYTKE